MLREFAQRARVAQRARGLQINTEAGGAFLLLFLCGAASSLRRASSTITNNRDRMSRRFSLTSNPVRASESQDEAEPLLGDAGVAERAGDVDAARDDGGETQLILTFAVRTTLPPSPRRAPAGEGAGPRNSAAAGPVGASSAARKSASAARVGRIDGRPSPRGRHRGAPRSPGGRRRPSTSPTPTALRPRATLETVAPRRRGAPGSADSAAQSLRWCFRRAGHSCPAP